MAAEPDKFHPMIVVMPDDLPSHIMLHEDREIASSRGITIHPTIHVSFQRSIEYREYLRKLPRFCVPLLSFPGIVLSGINAIQPFFTGVRSMSDVFDFYFVGKDFNVKEFLTHIVTLECTHDNSLHYIKEVEVTPSMIVLRGKVRDYSLRYPGGEENEVTICLHLEKYSSFDELANRECADSDSFIFSLVKGFNSGKRGDTFSSLCCNRLEPVTSLKKRQAIVEAFNVGIPVFIPRPIHRSFHTSSVMSSCFPHHGAAYIIRNIDEHGTIDVDGIRIINPQYAGYDEIVAPNLYVDGMRTYPYSGIDIAPILPCIHNGDRWFQFKAMGEKSELSADPDKSILPMNTDKSVLPMTVSLRENVVITGGKIYSMLEYTKLLLGKDMMIRELLSNYSEKLWEAAEECLKKKGNLVDDFALVWTDLNVKAHVVDSFHDSEEPLPKLKECFLRMVSYLIEGKIRRWWKYEY
jgi:hypothetical protein